ncbi:DMT family transporter [Azospirillum thermophilum]|uniref:EamA/RhaT family transporter n=1 Tax=Azospirillum thermophilum TaxID=2202148 RepID=A0A2S2CME5_9PROT|nr:DMT family transporter [Azospirillum thermophilum]AWK85685.1 EamA/RhaT family transporter [Azospirillum thermophilum]
MIAACARVVSTSAFGLLIVCGFLFASRFMVAKAALSVGMMPVQLGVVGNLGAGLALLPWLLASGDRIPLGRRHLALYAALGVVTYAYPTVLSNLVVERVGPAYASTVYSLSPLLTMSFAAGLGVERMFLRRFVGIVVGFAGMVLLVRQQVMQFDLGDPIWVMLGLTIPASVATGNIIRSAWWPRGTSVLAFSAAALFTSALMMAVLAPAIESPAEWPFATLPGLGWLAVLIGVSALSQVLNFRLQQIGGPVVFSQIGYWGTGFGVLLAAVLFGDVLTGLSLAGLGCIVCGGALARRA